MAFFHIPNIKLVGISASVPKTQEDNSAFFETKETTEEFAQLTGISKRRVASKNQTAALLCEAAAEKLFEKTKWNKEEIQILVFITQTPNQPIPGDANLIKSHLGLNDDCLAIDINQGCSGYVYGLSVISSMMSAAGFKKGLLLVGDTITQTLDAKDKSTVPLFSDAGSASLLEFNQNANGLSFDLSSNGKNYTAIHQNSNDFLNMNGHEVYYYAAKEVPLQINNFLRKLEIHPTDIDYTVLHQANKLINESIRKKTGFIPEQTLDTLGIYGNTSCASIPVTLVHHLQQANNKSEKSVLLCGFGVGLSTAACHLNISDIVCPEMLELS